MTAVANFQKIKKRASEFLLEKYPESCIVIQIGSATCENAAGSDVVFKEFKKHIKAAGRKDVILKHVGCTGRCSLEPIVSIKIPSKKLTVYKNVDSKLVNEIFMSHIKEGKILEEHLIDKECKIPEKSKSQKELEKQPITHKFFEVYADIPFYCMQTRIALRNSGLVDPLSVYEYIQYGGFNATANILEKNDRKHVIDEVTKSKLRGRGGAGFLTGKKWNFITDKSPKPRYMICNADEGDPGAFMDRSMLESDPFSVIEGLIIAGFAIDADKGFFYVRAEYPLAVERIQKAIDICYHNNLLGKNILGSDFSYDLEIRLGAGAFVCGEETALIHSIEGERGQPRVRPPFPAQSGLWGQPTIINNVETLANLAVVFSIGGDEFAKIGTEKSGGTKTFAVSGKVKHTGLVEVPMGTSLNEIVNDICGGVPDGKKLKAVQTGGPAGGCIPVKYMDTAVDYETLHKVGSIMGSGGLIVLDEDDCMVQISRFFMSFSQDESCGKCTPCREGTVRMLEILDRIIAGKGEMEDLDKLNRLGRLMQRASLCGLGRACPNPVLSAFKYYEDEYISHIKDKKCPSKVCTALIHYEVDPEKCVGCTACAKNCPVQCISGEVKKVHHIDQSICIKCGKCFDVCRFGAIKRL
ncbi:MAG: NADP-reducing hydrogenase subunit HndC [Candidatus Anoxychlamydiales bacterium]|uniref:4Fe-4S ferredoxin-type domain-containing protein n=1 Tax=marine sediment metagenome TaxID=412755 RepID=A0A0F9KGG5_9ZZZZ|nr:NADP-reducing hydrogenase subunit HndC [Candidatus Anoxychlamydiales bacterium]